MLDMSKPTQVQSPRYLETSESFDQMGESLDLKSDLNQDLKSDSIAPTLGQKITKQLESHPRKYAAKNNPEIFNGSLTKRFSRAAAQSTSKPAAQLSDNMKSLEACFNYNGHMWEAHEVLGIPVGTPLNLVTSTYQTALKQADHNTHEFLHAAYTAILDKY